MFCRLNGAKMNLSGEMKTIHMIYNLPPDCWSMAHYVCLPVEWSHVSLLLVRLHIAEFIVVKEKWYCFAFKQIIFFHIHIAFGFLSFHFAASIHHILIHLFLSSVTFHANIWGESKHFDNKLTCKDASAHSHYTYLLINIHIFTIHYSQYFAESLGKYVKNY